MSDTTTTTTDTSPVVAAEQARDATDLAELDAEAKLLADQQLAIAAKRAAVQARAQQPRDPHALGLKARDAVLNYLAHRNGADAASQPETAAWQAIAAFFDALGN